jgi:hypothetical protein
MNAGGGAGLTRFYLGPNSRGNGSLTALGLQYELSVGRLLRYPAPFWGEGPDLTLGLFGMYATVRSVDPLFDRVGRYKLGTELTYNALSWFSAQGRLDRIVADTGDASKSRTIATARLIAKTEWLSHERVWLQYSRYFNANGVVDPFTNLAPLDHDFITLAASMWW